MTHGGSVYTLANDYHTVLYVGVTSDLPWRITQHREKFYPKSFTARYNISKLVYYELFHSIKEAISREKQIKAGSRTAKIELVQSMNPEWKDLYDKVKLW